MASRFLTMTKGSDVIMVEITDDGVIKYTTNPISGMNHANAEQFRRALGARMGKAPTATRRGDVISAGKLQNRLHTHNHE